jgi:hypothetical protein
MLCPAFCNRSAFWSNPSGKNIDRWPKPKPPSKNSSARLSGASYVSQRCSAYVWRSTLVRELLDSLYRGYPSGAILIWETDERLPEHKQVQRITR